MSRTRRIAAILISAGALTAATASSALGDAPGPGDKQCLDHKTGNSHCPQNK